MPNPFMIFKVLLEECEDEILYVVMALSLDQEDPFPVISTWELADPSRRLTLSRRQELNLDLALDEYIDAHESAFVNWLKRGSDITVDFT